MAIEFLDEIAPAVKQKKQGVEFVDNLPPGSTIEFLDEPTPQDGRGASGSWTPNTSATSASNEVASKVGPYSKAVSSDSKSMNIYLSGLDAFLNGDRATASRLANEAYRLDPKNIEARNLVERMQRNPTAGTVKPSWDGNNFPVIPKTGTPSPSVAVNFVKGLPGLARDVASQSAREIGSSGAYVGAGAVRGATMGYVDPTSLIEKSPYLSGADISKQTAENVGSMIGVIAPITAIAKGVGAGLKTAQVFNTVRPWLQNIFQAGVTGGVFGASRNPGENESRAQNAANDAGLFMAFTGTAQAIQRAFVKDVLIPDAKKAEVLQKATDAGIDAYAKGGSKSEAGRVFTEILNAEAKAAREAVKAGVPGTQDIQSPGYKEPATVVKTPTALSNAINRIIERIRKPSVSFNQPIDAISSTERQAGGIGQDVAPIDNGSTSGYDLGGQGGVPNVLSPGGLSVSRGMVPGGPASPFVPVAPRQGGTPSAQIAATGQPVQGMVPPELAGNETPQSAPSPTGEVSPSESAVAPTKKYRIPKTEIEGYAEYLWRQAIEERSNATGLEQFIIENNGMRSNGDTEEEFQSVPLHLRGIHPVDEMRQMAIDAGFPNVPDDLNYWAGSLKKRGPLPKKYMFIDQAKRELENEYETYGPPSRRDSGPQIDFGNAEPIPFENKASYGVKEQGDLFAAPKENVGQAFDRLVAHAKQQGFSQPEAMAYAKRTLAAQGRGAEAPQGGPQASQMEMGAPGGVEGFGRGQKGQGSLFEGKATYGDKKDLIIQHNVTAENILHAEKIGGFPVPSLAITKKDKGITGFGDITLIGDKSMADPKGYAKTQVFGSDVYSPRYPTIHYKIKDSAIQSIKSEISKGIEKAGPWYADLDELQRRGAGYLKTVPQIRIQFAEDNGISVPEILDQNGRKEEYLMGDKAERGIYEAKLLDKFGEFADGLFNKLSPEEAIFSGYNNLGRRKYKPHTLENVVNALKKDLRGGESQSNIYGPGQLRAKFTPKFRSIEQIRKAKGKLTTKENFAKIKAEVESDLLSISDKMKSYYKHKPPMFGFQDTVMAVMEDTPKKGLSNALNEYDFEDVPEEIKTEIRGFMQKLVDLPTEYFEAKILRGVALHEFRGAVVPEGTKPELISLLEKRGLEIQTYKKGDEGERLKAVDALATRLGSQSLFEKKSTYGTNAPVFYSRLQRAVEEKMPNSAPAVMVRNLVDPTKGNVKAEEVEWSGINEWLLGKEKVTKAEVLDFLKQNQVEVKEVVKDDTGGFRVEPDEDNSSLFNVIANNRQGTQVGEISVLDGAFKATTDSGRESPKFASMERAIAWFNEERPIPSTKFANYQLPGGENYREILLTLPPLPADKSIIEKNKYGEWVVREPSTGNSFVLNAKTREEAEAEARPIIERRKDKQNVVGNFNSSHFDEPNILAHIRMNDRTTTDGKKVLFLEEVQSDWHQQGREKGYAAQGKTKDVGQLAGIEKDGYWEIVNNDGQFITNVYFSDAKTENEAITEARRRLANNESARTDIRLPGVPNAPFKKTWHELALKRMLRYAVDNEYDGIAWTTGEQQNERYDLSKQVKSIEWAPDRYESEGIKHVTISMPDSMHGFNVSPDGKIGYGGGEFAGKKLDDVVGKEIAKKILDSRNGNLSGDGLKIGGTGMRGFYDQIIPSFLNKYTKKWGGRVSVIDLNQGDVLKRGNEYQVWRDGKLVSHGKTESEARLTAHFLDITPAMRESVAQGQAMFEKKSPYAAGPNQLDLWRPTGEGQHQRPVDIPKAIRESIVVKELKETGFLDVHTTTIESPEDIAAIFSFMQNNNMESMYAIGMDGAGKMLGVQMVGMGNINQIPISARDTLAGMHAMGAAKVSFAHNHPSHDPNPSKEDIHLTKILADLAKSADMEVLHHIVIDGKTFGLVHPDGRVEMRPFSRPKPTASTVRTVAPQQKWDVDEELELVNQPEIAAELLSGFQQKHPGVVLLALNTKNKVNSIWHVSSSLPLNPGKLVAMIGKISMRNAAASVIVSTNVSPNAAYIKAIKSRLSPWGIELLDWVGFPGDFAPVTSARRQGIIGESKASYGKVDQTQTPAFRKWFGDSVVTDTGKPMSEGGKPLVVYHGGLKFNTFGINDRELRIGKRADGFALQEHLGDGNWTWTGPPFKTEQEAKKYLDEIPKTSAAYATESQDVAESYADQYGNSEQEVKSLYLNLANPLDLRDPSLYKKWVGEIGDTFNAQELNMAHGSREIRSGGKVLSDAKKAGYDGVVFYDTDVYDKGAETAYAFFSPNQAKSATGNSGAFNPKNPSILKESGGGYGGKPPTPPVSPGSDFGSGDAYEANRLLAKKGSFTHYKAGDILKASKDLAETILTPISTVLKNIDPSLKVAIRRHVFTVMKDTHDDLHTAMPFMARADTMPQDDQADLDLAGKNGDISKIKEIISKHGAWAQYDAYRRTMDSLRDRAIASGVDMGYLSDYFPRIVEDKAGFLEAVQADTRWPDIAALIEQAETGGILSDDDKIALINNYLRGYSQGVINIKTPGNVKTRTIAILSPRMNRFYMDWRPAAIRYVEGMNKMIGDRAFFGKSAKNADEGPDLFGINKNKIDTEKSIGAFIKDAVESGRVKRLDEQGLRGTLDAYFNQKTPGLAIKIYRDITTMQTIGNAIAALTQLQDIGVSLYRAPLEAIPNFIKAFVNRSEIKLTDLGLDSIAEEFSTRTKLSRSVSAVLKLSGLTGLDRITAETTINSIIEKYRSQARRGMVGGLEERLRAAVGEKWEKVADELANGKTSPDVLELAFNEILDVQPKALTELPRGYLKGGNARIFYMLKTFQLRQMDYIRAEAFHKMAQPGLKNKAIGMGRLVSMVAVLGAMGVTTDQLKDWVLGRKTDFSDRIIDNILKLAGLSKWTIYKARQEGFGSASMKTILPPAPIIDQLWKDVATAGDGKGTESVQSIPLIGKPYYWRFGRGREKTLAKHPELRTPSIDSRGRTLRPRPAPAQRSQLRQRVMVKR